MVQRYLEATSEEIETKTRTRTLRIDEAQSNPNPNSKSKVRQSRAKAVVAKVNSSSSTPAISSDVAELKDMVRALLLDKKNQSSAPAPSLPLLQLKQLNRIVLPAVVLTRTKTVPLPAEMFIKTTSKSQLHRTQVNQPLAYQAPAYQAPVPQTQSVSQTDFERYVKANDAVLRNIQSQGQRPGTFPGNTITNPKEDLKGITTRSGVAYQGPTIPTPSKVVKQGTEVTTDQVPTPSSQSTAPVQPPVAQSETPVSDPVAAPVSAQMPNLKPSIPYHSRRDNERRRMDECLALADLRTSINLMPLFVWKGLSLPELTPTCMTLELADRSVSKPIGIAKDVLVKVVLLLLMI
nr:reverse transcriptase domain-containing protein [Tanacetum cinerariifolium]